MKTLLITVMTLLFHPVLQAQTCIQPGSLVSIFNTKKGNYEYLVFKFVAPYNSKGVLTQGPSNLFSSDNRAGKTYHRISFSDISSFCHDKWILNLPQEKILDFKTPEMGNGNAVYLFELAPGAKITAHTAYKRQIYHFVKIRIE
ncbi:MAG TPA: hypothetical protein DHV17_05945 [Chitinophagaceae bacterium]|nr:hypothetical protein [Chitinophagaceae bacterium]